MATSTIKSLEAFLLRHPWSSESQLQFVFGDIVLEEMLSGEADNIQFFDIPDIGRCYASKRDTEGGLVRIRRLNIVRNFLLSALGRDGMVKGFSPTPVADAECAAEDCWWRVWGDLGFAAPESLSFVQHPPETYAPIVKDVIVVPSEERLSTVSFQVSKKWGGENSLFVYVAGSSEHQVIKPPEAWGKTQNWQAYEPGFLNSWVKERLKKDRLNSGKIHDMPEGEGVEKTPSAFIHYHTWRSVNKFKSDRDGAEWYLAYKKDIQDTYKRNRELRNDGKPAKASSDIDSLGALSSVMSEADWAMVVFIGDNPIFNQWELIRVLGTEIYYGPTAMNSYSSSIPTDTEIRSRYLKLRALGLIEELDWKNKKIDISGRVIPSAKAIQMFFESWGVLPDDFQQFHPWPHTLDVASRLRYGVNWVSKLYEHQTLCRQFALSVALGGKSISNGYGRVETTIVTTVGSRFAFASEEMGEQTLDWISPDGYLQTTVYYKNKVNEDGKEICVAQSDLLIEIDRATNNLPRLAERIQKYKRLMPALSRNYPVLVWITKGPDEWEDFILTETKKAGLVGYTVRLNRLIIGKDDPWWLTYPTARGFAYEYAAVGGMAPYREVWRCTEEEGKFVTLLGKKTWALSMDVHVGRPPEYSKVYRQY